MSLTFGSLFSGIGGIDLGLTRAGMVCKFQVEIDIHARRVLTKHWPNVPKHRDVRECGRHNLERVDLIAGGFPCQDISHAGKRVGIGGERSGLWAEFHRIISELRPRYVLVENVTGLLDRGIERVLGELAEIGYDAEWEVISACAFGAPHPRERVFIVAYPASVSGRWQRRRLTRTTESYPQRNLCWQEAEPPVERMADGVPNRLDRRRGLGNAVVPDNAEWLGKLIIKADQFSRAR